MKMCRDVPPKAKLTSRYENPVNLSTASNMANTGSRGEGVKQGGVYRQAELRYSENAEKLPRSISIIVAHRSSHIPFVVSQDLGRHATRH